MQENTEPLILDLVQWIAKEPRAYDDVMDAWRTSCPRLTIWEDAVDRGYVTRTAASRAMVQVTEDGRQYLAENNRA